MTNILDVVDAVYIINLPERSDRRARMKHVLTKIGLTFDDENVVLFPAFKVGDAGGFPSAGVKGCFLSHKRVIELAKEAGHKQILILEDDVEFARGSKHLIENLLNTLDHKLPSGFFYFGYENPLEASRFVNSRSTEVAVKEVPGRIVCAHAYTVSHDIFDALIDHLDECLNGEPGDEERGPMDVDGAYNSFRRRYPQIKAHVADPQLAWQRATHSDLHARSWHQTPGIRIVLAPLRKVRNQLVYLLR